MLDFLKQIGLTFVPLFVAMDVIGVLPIMISLTANLSRPQFDRMVRYAIFSALGLGLAFLALGKGIFTLMGIEVRDFLIGGGIILFLISAKDLVTGKILEADLASEAPLVGAVPIGIPLIVGPAVLTTLLLLMDQYSIIAVLISFIVNLAIAWAVITQMQKIVRFLGNGGVKVVSKVAALLLAAIAVKMIRQGILD
ncbi:MAG: MarC family protein [Dehalococcoidia bacterium]|nr:MarC family protein [Dehalococcoidia bacterium]